MNKGYKVFDKDLKCRGFQFEIGKTYTHEGAISLCKAGFHFHTDGKDLFNCYEFISTNRVCEIEFDEKNVLYGDDKSVTGEIKIIKELTWHEVLEIVNIGKNCTGRNNSGYRNSGNRNSGDWNSGNGNSGNGNSGDWNSGNGNSGYWNSGNGNSGNGNSGNRNSGDRNSGDWNSGNRNSGNRNSGDWNSGDWNSGNRNSGYLNTQSPTNINIFDRPCEQKNISFPNFFYFDLCVWIELEDMTEQEKFDNEGCEYTLGYLKTIDYKEAWRMSWDKAPLSDREKCLNLPNWDNGKFLEITGIDVEKELREPAND